ncbi:MAG: O-antigen ligase family protein, partial [Humidesulfovibrio sp.]|nr:O-antigen ligase family protein [Humidesulfovibrio sp.]
MTGTSLVVWSFVFLGIIADITIFNPGPIFHYGSRVLYQFICMIFAVHQLAFFKVNIFRHAILNMYLAIIFVSSFVADSQLFVLLQMFSLASIVLFCVAITQSDAAAKSSIHQKIVDCTAHVYFATCFAGLVFAYFAPSHVYYIGPFGGIPRFSGVFSAAGVLGLVSGILLGYAILIGFGQQRMSRSRSAIYVITAASSMLLSLTRTHVIAALCSLAFIVLLYSKKKLNYFLILICILISMFAVYIFKYSDGNFLDYQNSKLVRMENISSAAGRTSIWEEAFKNFIKRPFLGYGLARGGCASFAERSAYAKKIEKDEATIEVLKDTCIELHNGYIQAFVDLGLFGGCVYVYIIISNMFLCFKYD